MSARLAPTRPHRRAARKTAVLAAVFAAVAMLLGGCADDDSDDNSDDDPGVVDTAATEPTSPSSSASPSSPASAAADTPVEFRVVAQSDVGAGPDSPPPADAVATYDGFACPGAAVGTGPADYVVACDGDQVKYLLEPAAIVGGVEAAEAEIPEQQVSWVVTIDLDAAATAAFADLSSELVGTGRQFAILLDAEVLSAPTMDGVITNGKAQISGNFTEQQARDLAQRLTAGG